MPLWNPSEQDLQALFDDARLKCGTTPALLDNYIVHALFNKDKGLYAWSKTKPIWTQVGGEWVRTRRRLRMREWIEHYVRIQNKAGDIVPMVLNAAQRSVVCTVYQMERAGMPVRITILKARQLGMSTLVQAIYMYVAITGENVKGLLVADTGDRAEMLLEIANTMRKHLPKCVVEEETVFFKLKMKSEAAYTLVWREPIGAQIKIASAEEPDPGQGGTRKVMLLSESSSATFTSEKIVNILPSLPTLPGTLGFNESTPRGNNGWFYDTYMAGKKEEHLPLRARRSGWVSRFFPWWAHHEYVWTKTFGYGREIPEQMIREITRTLTADEEWILQQKYMKRWSPTDEWLEVPTKGGGKKWSRRNVGMVSPTYDQLAWRRAKLEDPETSGDVNLLNSEYAKDDMSCFLSSGRSVFDREILLSMIEAAKDTPPIWTGSLEEPLDAEGNRKKPVGTGLSWDPLERKETEHGLGWGKPNG